MPGKNHYMHRVFFIALCICFCFAADALCFEYPRYDINATIDTDAKTITATQTVTFTNNSTKPVDELFFHIYGNRRYTEKEKKFMLNYASYFKINPFPGGFQSGKTEILAITRKNKPLLFSVEGEDKTLLKVLLNGTCRPGKTVTVAIDYTVSIPHAYGRFGWHNDIIALSRWYPILSVLNESGWSNYPFYPFHRPFFSDAAYYSVKFTVPVNQTVIHSGQLDSESKDTSSTKKLHIRTPMPVRDFSLAMSPRYKIYQGTLDNTAIKSFYLPGDEFYAKKAFESARDLMKFYSKLFGKYPYKEFSIAPVYLGYGGEQASNMVLIDTRVYKLPKMLTRYFDFFISHEAGHQWFYNIVGIDGYTQMWLEEGVNSYFNLQYLEDKYGYQVEVVEWPRYLDWLLPNLSFRRARDTRYKMIARTKLDQPVSGRLSGFTEPSKIFSLTYGKGAAILSMLRYYLGDDVFYRVFNRIFDEFRFRNLSMQDFIALCEDESGEQLDWFFNQWLNTSEKCDYAVTRVDENTISIENKGGIVMPVKVRIEFADGTHEVIVAGGRDKEEIRIHRQSAISQVIVDPDEELLDIDRTNNSWPRIVNIDLVPLYLGLRDIPVFLENDFYNIVVGPELAGGGMGLKASFQKPYDYNFYAASDYDFNDQLHKSRVGFQLNNILNTQTVAGFEISNTDDYDDGQEDLVSGRVYIRRELWPARYGLSHINDHVTLYLIRNRSLSGDLALSGLESARNVSYLKRDEAIVGGVLHLGRAGPYPDPKHGFTLDTLLENSGHFLGATQYFYRAATDLAIYQPVTPKTTVALRLKYGWGYPDDKNLYQLGGLNGLRGYDRKTIRGSNTALGSVEFRFPIIENIDLHFLDNIIGLESISGVVFFDAGKSWFDDIDDSTFRKDAGGGLRLMVNIGAFLERVLVRFDAAQAISDSGEDVKFWFGVNHAY